MTTQVHSLSGLHCGACIDRVTRALAPLAEKVDVTLAPMQVTLTNPSADFNTLQGAVAQAGAYVLMPNRPVAPEIRAQAAISSVASQSWAGTAESLSWFATYRPLLLIVAYILGASVLVQTGLGTAVDISAIRSLPSGK